MTHRLLGAALMAAAVAAGPVAAQEAPTPQPFKDFTFKRVKPPEPGATRRITVQIAPAGVAVTAPAATVKPSASASAAPPPEHAYATAFWAALSSKPKTPGPGRLLDAMEALSGVPAPRLQELHSMADAYGRVLMAQSAGTQVSPAFALAVMAVESGGDVRALSSAGAAGLMQLMPATAARFGVGDVFAPADNIGGGMAVLNHLMEVYGGDPVLVLAGYNAGEGAVRDHGGVPPFAETRAYIPKVLAAFAVARTLCVTPPYFVSDGCVFQGQSG
ncbi:MAG: lytic transglycosylase domain-containing protein [Pseudomonadota bacterium]